VRRRAIILVLDGVGIGAAPDAAEYGDAGSDTLGNLARACGGLSLPNLTAAGLGNIAAAQEHYGEAIDFAQQASRLAAKRDATLAHRSEGNLGWYYNELGDRETVEGVAPGQQRARSGERREIAHVPCADAVLVEQRAVRRHAGGRAAELAQHQGFGVGSEHRHLNSHARHFPGTGQKRRPMPRR